MNLSHRALAVTDTDVSGLAAQLDDEINSCNVEVTGQPFNGLFRISPRGDDDELLGGLPGSTWGRCAHIDLLWVRADLRRRGLGGELLAAVEAELRAATAPP